MTTTSEHRCFRCDKPVTDEELASGKAYERDGYYVCPACLADIRAGAAHSDVDTMKSQLATMTAELRGIAEHLHHGHFSWLFVLGGILEAVVLIVLYRAYVAADPSPVLLWAVIVQLMAITAFIVGKLR